MIEKFARITGYRIDDILGYNNKPDVCSARFVYWRLLYLNGYCKSTIARICGRNHATVLSGLKRVEDLISIKDPFVCELVEKTKNIKR